MFSKLICTWWSWKTSWSRSLISIFRYALMKFLFNHFVRRKEIRCLKWASELSWWRCGCNLLWKMIQNSLRITHNEYIGREFPIFSSSSFFSNTFIFTYFQTSDVNPFWIMMSWKICQIISFVTSFDVFYSNPVAVWRFTSFEFSHRLL